MTGHSTSDLMTAHRYYLSGIDWVMAALDRLNKNHTGLGNHSQLVLVLKGSIDKTIFEAQLAAILPESSFLKGRIKRAWNLAPYWCPEALSPSLEGKIQRCIHDILNIRFFRLDLKNKNSLDFFIQKCALTPFKNNHTMLGFDLVYCNGYTYLIMRFDHRMFDARGAEALLERILIYNSDSCGDHHLPRLPAQRAQLNLWKSRFLSGQIINRFLRKIYHKINDKGFYLQKNEKNSSKVHYIPYTARLNGNLRTINLPCFFYTKLSKSQTAAVYKNAIKRAGYLMDGVYILGCVTKAFDSLFKKNRCAGNMLIPINVDMRGTKFNSREIFFNHLSFMLFNVEQDLSVSEYINNLKEQFIDQVKNKIPYHFINASLLMRIMPINIISGFMDRKMKEFPCSFSFSYIGEQAFNLKYVHDLEVVNMFHLPIVPVNPGIGVFFTRFNKRLNMVISTYNDRLDGENGRYLQEKIIAELLK